MRGTMVREPVNDSEGTPRTSGEGPAGAAWEHRCANQGKRPAREPGRHSNGPRPAGDRRPAIERVASSVGHTGDRKRAGSQSVSARITRARAGQSPAAGLAKGESERHCQSSRPGGPNRIQRVAIQRELRLEEPDTKRPIWMADYHDPMVRVDQGRSSRLGSPNRLRRVIRPT